MSKIEWCDETWNPVVGCKAVSEGCRHCYAARMAYRLQAMKIRGYQGVARKIANGSIQWTGKINFVSEALAKPLRRKKPTLYFINSMSDLFYEKIPFEFVDQIFDIIVKTPQHRYQILTKRASRLVEYFVTRKHHVPSHVWLGVTVENRHSLTRIDELRKIRAHRFLSIEPLLEDLHRINLKGIHWVIVGGESGSGARPMQAAWVKNILHQSQTKQVDFFFKQWGNWGEDGQRRTKKANGRLFEGEEWNHMPVKI